MSAVIWRMSVSVFMHCPYNAALAAEPKTGGLRKAYRARDRCNQQQGELIKNIKSPSSRSRAMFFTFPEDARPNAELQAVEFGERCELDRVPCVYLPHTVGGHRDARTG